MPLNSYPQDYNSVLKALQTILNKKLPKNFKARLVQLRLPSHVIITGLILLSRLVNFKSLKQPENPEKLFMTCLVLAQQSVQDIPYSIKLWSRLTAYSTTTLNQSRWQAFQDLDYCVEVEGEEFYAWQKALKALS